MKAFQLVVVAILSLVPVIGRSQIILDSYYVHAAYLTPTDRAYSSAYEQGIHEALFNLQSWFAGQLGGRSFRLSPDPVQWYAAAHDSAYYNRNAANGSTQFFNATLGDAFAYTGFTFYDTNDIWLYYFDADPVAGQITGGTQSVALFPAGDLQGLSGGISGRSRWIGGSGHELGHAFNLPHPPDSPGGSDDRSLMYLGYLDYPNTYLRASDRASLLASGFFFPIPELRIMPALVLAVSILTSFRLRERTVRPQAMQSPGRRKGRMAHRICFRSAEWKGERVRVTLPPEPLSPHSSLATCGFPELLLLTPPTSP